LTKQGRVEVDVHYRATAPINALKALGAKIETNVPALSTVELFIAPAELAYAARLASISRITFPRYAFSDGTGSSSQTQSSVIDARAKQVMHMDELTHAIKTSGKGVKVLVFATGAEHIAEAADAGALPNTGAIWVDPNFTGTGDEGIAMLELVHAIAPSETRVLCSDNGSDIVDR
jgi:hypothetical protein